MARELSQMASRKLRNGCLDGCIRGFEDEIRQDAILLSLRWYVRGLSDDGGTAPRVPDWNPGRAIAHSLHFTKMRYARRYNHEANGSDGILEARVICMHPACLHESELPTAHRMEMVREGIAQAQRRKIISPGNACVAELVLCDGVSVAEAAAQTGCHRSAIYQHLTRTRAALRMIIGNIEIPFIS